MEIPILYQDEHLLVVNKPNNMLVHASYYARNIKEDSLVKVLSGFLEMKLFPVHRLDYKTSGAIIVAKSGIIAADLQKQFETGNIKKTYMALVRGFANESGIIDSPVKNPDTGKYKDALTHYKTLKQIEVAIPVEPYPQSRYSLVEFSPQTGRMHQLRKHANKISHPIIGDHKYGNRHHNRMFEERLKFPNMFLHASKIVFIHPLSKAPIELAAPLPPFWEIALTKLMN